MQGGNDGPTNGPEAKDERDYSNLLKLDEMESLFEELEEMGISGDLRAEQLPDDLSEIVRSLDVHSVDELTTRIGELHAMLDRQESE